MAISSAAQLQVGQNLHLTASGNLSAGYSASYGDQASSEHELDFGGDASINGYYFAPSFVTFNVLPYYGQSRANSNYQSISGSSGVSSTAEFFSGSRFPGTIAFTKDYNSLGTYGVVGTPSFTTHGSGQGYSATWSALLPNWPTLSVGYSASSGSSSIYGSSAQSGSTSHTFSARSSYNLAGFRVNGFYSLIGMHGNVPAFLSGESDEHSSSAGHSEGFSASHRLPLNGSVAMTFSRQTNSSNYIDTSTSNTTDTLTANASFRPIRRLSLSTGMSYSDNLAGTLNQQIIAGGGSAVSINGGEGSHTINLNGGMSYTITPSMGVSAVVTHVDQYFGGYSSGATYISGTLFYNRRLLNMFTFSVTGLDSATDAGNSAAGMQSTVNFGKRFGAWDTTASFSYGQNVQTQLVTYTTSYMNYDASVGRALTRRLTWNSGFGGSHSGFSQQVGTNSHAEAYYTSLSYRRYNFGGTYSSSNGVSVLTANGLSTVGITTVISPLDRLVYDATSYSFSASGSPFKKLSIGGSYSNSRSNTFASAVSSRNQSTSLTSQLHYNFRRMGFMAGYTRFAQGISAGGAPAAGISSYYFGVSRWVSLF